MKKNFLRKVCSVMFAAIMVISLIPMNVFAAEGSTESVNIEIIEEGITITQLGASAYKVEGLPEEEGYSWYYQPEKLSAGQSISEGIQRVIDDYTEAPNDRINELVSALNSANVMTTFYDKRYREEFNMSDYDFVRIVKKKDGSEILYAIAVLPLPKESAMGHSTGVHEEATWKDLNQFTTAASYLETGYYYLTGDYAKTQHIAAGEDVVICLNGHTWSNSALSIKVSDGATLRICDCSEGEIGVIGGTISPENESTIELHSGTIGGIWNQYTTSFTYNMYGGKNNAQKGYGINLDGANSECTINIYDGVIVGTCGIRLNQASINGVINIYGGVIEASGSLQDGGYAILHKGNGAVNISGGRLFSENVAAVYSLANEVNVSGDAQIEGETYGITFGDNASSAGNNKRPKLTISGKPIIYAGENGQAIRVFNTIDIEGLPQIYGRVYCGQSDSSIPYPMFNITGEFGSLNNPITVVKVNSNPVIARAWETIGFNKDDIGAYFTSTSTIAYDEDNDEVIFKVNGVMTTSPIEFKDGNKATFTGNSTSASLETLYTYNPDSYEEITVTAKDNDNEGTYTGRFDGNKFVIESQEGMQPGTYYVTLQQKNKNASERVTVEVEKVVSAPEVVPNVTSKPGVLAIENTTGEVLNLGIKIESTTGSVIVPWTKSPFEKDASIPVSVEAGTYIVSFCNIEDMQVVGKDEWERDVYEVPENLVKKLDPITVEKKPAPTPEECPEVIVRLTSVTISNDTGNFFYYKIFDKDNNHIWVEEPDGWDYLQDGEYNGLGLPSGEYYIHFCYAKSNYEPDEEAICKVEFTIEGIPAPTEDEIPNVNTDNAGVICIEKLSNPNISLYYQIKDKDGNTIKDWSGLYGLATTVIAPLEAGDYIVSFCYREAYQTGRIEESSVCSTRVTVTGIEFKSDNLDEEKNEYIIDYKDGKKLRISIALNDSWEDEDATKYYTFDGVNWYKLPNDKEVEIVVINSDPTVVPELFTSGVENTVSNYDDAKQYASKLNITFRNVFIEEIDLGCGAVVMIIDGDVAAGEIQIYASLKIVGADKKATLTCDFINVGNDPAGEDLIIENLKTLTVGKDYDYGHITITYGAATFSEIDNFVLFHESANGIYAELGIVFENVKNISIIGEGLSLLTSGDVSFKNSFGIINRLAGNERENIIEANATYIILDKETEIKAGLDAKTATVITLNEDNSLDQTYISKYLEIVGESVEAPEVSNPANTDVTVKVDGEVTFDVEAEGEDLHFQWQEKVNGGFVDIENATGSTYTANKFNKCGEVREYRCIVWNEGGEAEPVVFTVTVKHTLKEVEANDATCTATGNNAYFKCEVEGCGACFKDAEGTKATTVEAETIKMLDHDWATEWSKDGANHWHKCNDCTAIKDIAAHADADKDNVCDTCKTVLHKHELVKVPAKDATCTTAGNKEYYKCTVENCGGLFADAEGKTVTTLDAVTIPATDHTDANKDEVCDDCKDDLHKHVLTKVPAADATCTAAGNKEHYKCNCGKLFTDAEGKTAITLEAITIAPTAHADKDGDMVCDECKTELHKHVLVKVPGVAATCTTPGTKEHYKCTVENCTELFADAEGKTTITLEATKIAAYGHDWSGEWTVTKEATATEEGKKETLCERDCGQKKVVNIPKTGETDENGNLDKDAEVEAEAPIKEATLNNSKNELIGAGNIFTKEDKEAIERGEDARVWIEISKTDETTIKDEDKSKMEEEAADIMGEDATLTYFDVDLFKQVGNGKVYDIPKPGVAIKITIAIPEELLNRDKTIDREYKIIRLHTEGDVSEVDVISGEFNAETGEFSFETDRFSTYAIAYADSPVVSDTPEVPDTGDTTNVIPTLVLLFVGVAMLIIARKKSLNMI